MIHRRTSPARHVTFFDSCLCHISNLHDTYILSAFSVMWCVSPVKRGCCQCSPPVVAAFSLPSSCHPRSPLCTALAPMSWHSLLQPHFLSGERWAWVGWTLGRAEQIKWFLPHSGIEKGVKETTQMCPRILLAQGLVTHGWQEVEERGG